MITNRGNHRPLYFLELLKCLLTCYTSGSIDLCNAHLFSSDIQSAKSLAVSFRMEFYYHSISPPSQAVWMTLNMLGVNYEAKELKLFEGEQRSDWYKKINPLGKVPAIKDGEFTLAERFVIIYITYSTNP